MQSPDADVRLFRTFPFVCSITVAALGFLWLGDRAVADPWHVLSVGERIHDPRLGPLRTLDGYFPFHRVDSADAWQLREAKLRRQIAVAGGHWPEPTRTPLHAVVHSPVDRDEYRVWRVYFESFPGHFVTGSLYRPKHGTGKLPAVLSPHGHWPGGRFHQARESDIRESVAFGAERFLDSGRFPLQARCVQLVRMGCIVFLYDAVGSADSIQLEHRPGVREAFNTDKNWGLGSPQAELFLQNWLGLQTWNGLRALDFLMSLPDVDRERVAVTGASGGATQTMMIMAHDERPAAAAPCVMVSTAMQGGCTCENAPYLRIGAGNIDIAALIAPRPAAIMSADDWTVEFETKGYPELTELYTMLGASGNLRASFHLHFGHNYNAVNRVFMYGFISDVFGLGFETPILEREFVPLTVAEATVWTESHPGPKGEAIGGSHERSLVRWWYEDAREQIAALRDRPQEYREIVGGGWETMLGRTMEEAGEVAIARRASLPDDDLRGELILLENRTHQESVPMVMLYPSAPRPDNGVVIFLTDGGKAALRSDALLPSVNRLLESGYHCIGIDLVGQGEFLKDGTLGDTNRLSPRVYGERDIEPWRKFAGYTFGYNSPLVARRVHDVLTTIKATQLLLATDHVDLIGGGEIAPAIALAAKTQAGSAVRKVAAAIGDFRFANCKRFEHPMFLPGAVRYEDIDGLERLIGTEACRLDRESNTLEASGVLIDWITE